MSVRTPLIVSLLMIATMLAVSVWGWTAIPADARIAVHWGLDLRPDLYLPKTVGLFAVPSIATASTAFFALLPKIEPRRANLLASRKLYLTAWYGGIGLTAVVHLFIVSNAAGLPVDAVRWILFALALFFIAFGNFLGKSRSTFFLGLRLPWTLSSELAWEKSNRLTGRGLVATGLVALPALFFAGTMPGLLVLAIGTGFSFAAGGIASYVYWKRDPDRAPRNEAES